MKGPHVRGVLPLNVERVWLLLQIRALAFYGMAQDSKVAEPSTTEASRDCKDEREQKAKITLYWYD